MDPLAAVDATDLTGSVIAAQDIEELQASVVPWDLNMRQVSSGTLDARIHLGQVEDVLVTSEYWSHKIVAVGASPAFLSFNAQRLLMDEADAEVPSLSWSLSDAAWYWRRQVARR